MIEMTQPKTNLTQDQINEISERRRLRESIREIATKMALTYYTVWNAVQKLPDPEPALQEWNDQSNNESQSNTSPIAFSRVVEAELEESNEAAREGTRRALRIAELFDIDGEQLLTLGGLAHSLGHRTIGEFFQKEIVVWMR